MLGEYKTNMKMIHFSQN